MVSPSILSGSIGLVRGGVEFQQSDGQAFALTGFLLYVVNSGISRRPGFGPRWPATRRDYYMDPRSGWRTSVGLRSGARLPGGTNNFYKYYSGCHQVYPTAFRYAVFDPCSLWRVQLGNPRGKPFLDRTIFCRRHQYRCADLSSAGGPGDRLITRSSARSNELIFN